MPLVIITCQHHPVDGTLLGFRIMSPDDRERWPGEPMEELADEAVEEAFDAIVARSQAALGIPAAKLPIRRPVRSEAQFRVPGRYDIRIRLEEVDTSQSPVDDAVFLIQRLAQPDAEIG